MTERKPWYLSKGVWGSIITVVAAVAGANLEPGSTEQYASATVTVIAGAVALWGRVSAKTRIGG